MFLNFKRRSPKDKILSYKIKKYLGIKPKNLEVYRTAFIHKSAAYYDSSFLKNNNERLEFLGDSILDSVVSDYLYSKFPKEDEGFLTKLRSKIVKRKSLDKLAIKVNVHKLINHKSLTKNQKHVYGNALEALIGAIYIDKGFNFTKKYILSNIFEKHIDIQNVLIEESDFKSTIIEMCQKNHDKISFNCYEKYNDLKKNPIFGAIVSINGATFGEGEGQSKKEAEQNAAKEALMNLEKPDIEKN